MTETSFAFVSFFFLLPLFLVTNYHSFSLVSSFFHRGFYKVVSSADRGRALRERERERHEEKKKAEEVGKISEPPFHSFFSSPLDFLFRHGKGVWRRQARRRLLQEQEDPQVRPAQRLRAQAFGPGRRTRKEARKRERLRCEWPASSSSSSMSFVILALNRARVPSLICMRFRSVFSGEAEDGTRSS